MEFFFDRNIPEALCRMLGYFDRNHSVIYLDDQFNRTASDTDWLGDLAGRQPPPIVLTGDGRILRNPAECQVLRNSTLTFFLFADGWNSVSWADRAWKTVKIWPDIVRQATNTRKPTVFKIPISANKVERIALTSEIGGGRNR